MPRPTVNADVYHELLRYSWRESDVPEMQTLAKARTELEQRADVKTLFKPAHLLPSTRHVKVFVQLLLDYAGAWEDTVWNARNYVNPASPGAGSYADPGPDEATVDEQLDIIDMYARTNRHIAEPARRLGVDEDRIAALCEEHYHMTYHELQLHRYPTLLRTCETQIHWGTDPAYVTTAFGFADQASYENLVERWIPDFEPPEPI